MAERTDDAARRALEVLEDRLDERTAAYLNACVRCGLCADSCHVFLATGDPETIPAKKAERVARLRAMRIA